MESLNRTELIARLHAWARSNAVLGGASLSSQLVELAGALESVSAIVGSFSGEMTRAQSAEALSQLHVWLKDELVPRSQRIVELAEPIEDELHAAPNDPSAPS
jgi:hypothetical protein